MISKKLLSEILVDRISDKYIKRFGGELQYYSYGYDKMMLVDIHLLANICKEWAYDKHRYFLSTGKDVEGWFCLDRCNSKSWLSLTEPEAIFKACEWILKETSE